MRLFRAQPAQRRSGGPASCLLVSLRTTGRPVSCSLLLPRRKSIGDLVIRGIPAGDQCTTASRGGKGCYNFGTIGLGLGQ